MGIAYDPTRCAVLTQRMMLRCVLSSGTEIAHGTTRRYANSGTDIARACTRLRSSYLAFVPAYAHQYERRLYQPGPASCTAEHERPKTISEQAARYPDAYKGGGGG
eukprot:894571-Rhodomonas_salina.1